jgi:hypothetical protein
MTALTKLTDRFREADIDNEIVVMRIDNGDFFSLSGTAVTIWQLIDGERDRTALVAALTNEFEADEKQVATDVDALLAQLRGSGLLAEE